MGGEGFESVREEARRPFLLKIATGCLSKNYAP